MAGFKLTEMHQEVQLSIEKKICEFESMADRKVELIENAAQEVEKLLVACVAALFETKT